MKKVLKVRSSSQKALFLCELQSQIMDGWWENYRPTDHARYWKNVEVIVSTDEPRRNFYAKKSNYNFLNPVFFNLYKKRLLVIGKLAQIYTLEEVSELKNLFDEDGVYVGIPDDKTPYSDHLKRFTKYIDLKKVQALGESDYYSMRSLKRDLNKLKIAIKTYDATSK